MNCHSMRSAGLDCGARWGIELMFFDFKGCCFELEDSQLGLAGTLGFDYGLGHALDALMWRTVYAT